MARIYQYTNLFFVLLFAAGLLWGALSPDGKITILPVVMMITSVGYLAYIATAFSTYKDKTWEITNTTYYRLYKKRFGLFLIHVTFRNVGRKNQVAETLLYYGRKNSVFDEIPIGKKIIKPCTKDEELGNANVYLYLGVVIYLVYIIKEWLKR